MTRFDDIYKDLQDLVNDKSESKEDRIWAGILMQDIVPVQKELQHINEIIFVKELVSNKKVSIEELLNGK